ncbi:MAG TPA: hypothetical protein ENH91_12670 [Leeuwenhoekiella sp.]|nr:hypothetical protein [Leeuwenhoekiella sp.]
MNTISKSVLIAALAISNFSFANGNSFSGVKPQSISAEITQLLEKNSMELDAATTFQVIFVVNKAKEIVITDVDTDNLEIEQFIKSRLNYRKLKAATKCGQRYFLPVTIKVP